MHYISRKLIDFILRSGILLFPVVCQLLLFPVDSFGKSNNEQGNFENSIIDYGEHLNPLFKKDERDCTRYIIVHTSECDLETTLKIVSEGKQDGWKWISRGGHAHYVIARDGQTFRILDKKYRANHAGLSIWNGETDISRVSVGIELVAYYDGDITVNQYQSIRNLIDILRNAYRLNDLAVLTHSQVAYARPNEWIHKNHRGRKNCARNFDRTRAGLGPSWSYDPDVRAGRLQPEPVLAAIYYGDRLKSEQELTSNVIDRNRSAWAIAGEKYNSPNTLYKLPDGWIISGNRIGARIGWNRIPTGTEVFFD